MCKPEDCENCQDYSDDSDCEGYHHGAYRYTPFKCKYFARKEQLTRKEQET